ncbi:MAG: hypothetical protein ACR2N1_17765 [Rubripirellula sp.]
MSDDLQDTLENAAIFGAIQRGNIQRAQQMRPQGPPCPWCGGPIPRIGVKICMHCRKEIAWVGNTPCEPGMETAVRRQQEQNAKAAVEAERKTIASGLKWGCAILAISGIALFSKVVIYESGFWFDDTIGNFLFFVWPATAVLLVAASFLKMSDERLRDPKREAAKKQQNDRRVEQRKANASYAEKTRKLQEKYMKKR